MENNQTSVEEFKHHLELLQTIYKSFENMYNHAGKRFSEMNNTFTWATTIIIALLVIFTKHVPNTNSYIGYLFGTLIFLFIFFKAINILVFEHRMTNILDKYTSDCISINKAMIFDEDLNGFDESYYNNKFEQIRIISIILNIIFFSAMIVFFILVLTLFGFIF